MIIPSTETPPVSISLSVNLAHLQGEHVHLDRNYGISTSLLLMTFQTRGDGASAVCAVLLRAGEGCLPGRCAIRYWLASA